MTSPNLVEDRNTTTDGLQASLVELIDLALQGKQAHWNVQGPHFRSVHLQLDEIVADVRQWADDVAERLATLDVPADGRLSSIAEESNLEPMPEGWQKDDQVVKRMEERLSATATDIRQRMEVIEPLDIVTHDMLSEIVQGLEKHQWMIRSQLEG